MTDHQPTDAMVEAGIAAIREVQDRGQLGKAYYPTLVRAVLTAAARVRPTDEAAAECASCGEGTPEQKCPKSERPCGHHCNHSWTHDACDWCGTTFGDADQQTDPREQIAKAIEVWADGIGYEDPTYPDHAASAEGRRWGYRAAAVARAATLNVQHHAARSADEGQREALDPDGPEVWALTERILSHFDPETGEDTGGFVLRKDPRTLAHDLLAHLSRQPADDRDADHWKALAKDDRATAEAAIAERDAALATIAEVRALAETSRRLARVRYGAYVEVDALLAVLDRDASHDDGGRDGQA